MEFGFDLLFSNGWKGSINISLQDNCVFLCSKKKIAEWHL